MLKLGFSETRPNSKSLRCVLRSKKKKVYLGLKELNDIYSNKKIKGYHFT